MEDKTEPSKLLKTKVYQTDDKFQSVWYRLYLITAMSEWCVLILEMSRFQVTCYKRLEAGIPRMRFLWIEWSLGKFWWSLFCWKVEFCLTEWPSLQLSWYRTWVYRRSFSAFWASQCTFFAFFWASQNTFLGGAVAGFPWRGLWWWSRVTGQAFDPQGCSCWRRPPRSWRTPILTSRRIKPLWQVNSKQWGSGQ